MDIFFPLKMLFPFYSVCEAEEHTNELIDSLNAQIEKTIQYNREYPGDEQQNAILGKLFVDRGFVYANLENYAAAYEDFQVATDLLPEEEANACQYMVHFCHAQVLQESDSSSALVALDEAEKTLSDAPNAKLLQKGIYVLRWQIYLTHKQFGDAIRVAQWLIEEDPKDKDYKGMLSLSLGGQSVFYMKRQEYKKAIANLERALKLIPDTPRWQELHLSYQKLLGIAQTLYKSP